MRLHYVCEFWRYGTADGNTYKEKVLIECIRYKLSENWSVSTSIEQIQYCNETALLFKSVTYFRGGGSENQIESNQREREREMFDFIDAVSYQRWLASTLISFSLLHFTLFIYKY